MERAYPDHMRFKECGDRHFCRDLSTEMTSRDRRDRKVQREETVKIRQSTHFTVRGDAKLRSRGAKCYLQSRGGERHAEGHWPRIYPAVQHMCIPILMQYDAVTKIPQISLRCDESFNFCFRFTAGFFCQFVPNESPGAQAMKARRLFKSLDDDETGQISFKEILNHTKDCGFPESL